MRYRLRNGVGGNVWLEFEQDFGTPEFTMLPFRTADAPGQGELELVLNKPIDIQGAFVQYLGNLDLSAEIVGSRGDAVEFKEAETHNIFRLASIPDGALFPTNELDPTFRFVGNSVVSSLQVLVDATVNPLPITRG